MWSRHPIIVRAIEFGRINLPPQWNTTAIRERIEQAALKAGVRAFEIRGRQLYALGVVGVVDLGSLIVEILPKTHDNEPFEKRTLFLSELLRFGEVIDRISILDARTATGEFTSLEIIFARAVREAAKSIREGLPRRYEAREVISTAVRGRIELRHLARRRPGRDFELHIRHAPLSENNPLSRTVKWLLHEIRTRTRLVSTRRMCQRLIENLDGVGFRVPTLQELDQIVLQSTELRWRPLVDLSRLLLQQISPDPSRAGNQHAVAVLFTLHDIFERVLRRVFREGLPNSGLRLRRTNRKLLYALPPTFRGILPLKPDFIFESDAHGKTLLIGDAKWKTILTSASDIHLSEDDAYQLTTYLAAFQAPIGFIFCPLSSSDTDVHMTTASFRISGQGTILHIVGVNLPTLIAASDEGARTRAALCKNVADRLPVPIAA